VIATVQDDGKTALTHNRVIRSGPSSLEPCRASPRCRRYLGAPRDAHDWPKSDADWSPTNAVIIVQPGSDVGAPDDHPHGVDDARHHHRVESEHGEGVLVPLFDTQRHETVDARVRTIGHVEGAATQVPRQPGIDGGESEFARSSSRMIYEPARLVAD